MQIIVEKSGRRLTLLDAAGRCLLQSPVALGKNPVGPKEREGDGKTPEGRYFVCLKKQGRFGPALGVSYPSVADALRQKADEALLSCLRAREAADQRPPWGTALGGEIYIHGGGTQGDWTAGCIALPDEQALLLYQLTPLGTPVEIRP